MQNELNDVLILFAEYLNENPRAITAEMIGDITNYTSSVDTHTAFLSLFVELNKHNIPQTNTDLFIHDYIIPSIHQLQPHTYTTDPYYTSGSMLMI